MLEKMVELLNNTSEKRKRTESDDQGLPEPKRKSTTDSETQQSKNDDDNENAEQDSETLTDIDSDDGDSSDEAEDEEEETDYTDPDLKDPQSYTPYPSRCYDRMTDFTRRQAATQTSDLKSSSRSTQTDTQDKEH